MHIETILNALASPPKTSSSRIPAPDSSAGNNASFGELLRASTSDLSTPSLPATESSAGGTTFHHGSGLRVAVSGHAYDDASRINILDEKTAESLGMSHLKPAPGEETITTQGTYGVTMTLGPLVGHFLDEDGGVAGLPIGVKPLMPIAYYGVGDGEYGLGQPLFNSEAEKRAYWREKIGDFSQMLETERQLKAQYGDDIKLAYDHIAKEYVMLTPDDYGYADAKTGDQALADLQRDIRFTGLSRNEVNEILGY
ncbi:MAG: hypothetical protein V6Z89_01400 [Desulfobacter sp.]